MDLEMLVQTKIRTRGEQRKWLFRGIVADAKALGVNRSYLWEVLSGRVSSKRLTARYQELKRSQADTLAKSKIPNSWDIPVGKS